MNTLHIQRYLYHTIIVTDYYLPGRLAGGPITTIANMIEQLAPQLNALIVTRNVDMDGAAYVGINSWSIRQVQGADVLYLPPRDFTVSTLERVAQYVEAQQMYFNSFFSPITVGALLRRSVTQPLGRSEPRVILAPRGEFSRGALRIKAGKKKIYLKLFVGLGLQRQVDIYQASSALEKTDIIRALGPVPVHIAPDIPAPVSINLPVTTDKPRLVFISRISPKKNLLGALDLLAKLERPCSFDIYGPKEDMAYWAACERKIAALPPYISVLYKGTLKHHEVGPTLGKYSAFLFPTHGENFGHVIFEALAAGCPVLVSDQTPWQDLQQQGVGWVLPLSDTQGFIKAIEQILDESLEVRQQRATRCMYYAKDISENQNILEANLKLFAKH